MPLTLEQLYFKGGKDLFQPGVEAYADAHTSLPSELVEKVERDTQSLSTRIMLSDRCVGRLDHV
jgi:hypothetical protein